MRRHLPLLLLTLVTFASFLPQSAYAGPGTAWKRISSKHGSLTSDEQIGLIRRTGGGLGVAWVEHAGGSSALRLSNISASGKFKGSQAIVTGWKEIGGPDAIPTVGKGARIFFSGRKSSSDQSSLRSAVTANGAEPFKLEPEVRTSGDGIIGANVGAGVTSIGDPVVSWASSLGVRAHFGLTPSENFEFQHPVSTTCCAYSPDVASQPGGGGTTIGWFSNAGAGHVGVYASSVNPTTGAPVGSPMLMPGTANASLQYSRTPMTGRPSRGGIYMAYPTGADGNEVRVWLVGGAKSTVLAKVKPGSTLHGIGIAADPKNRLWVFWGVTSIYGGRVYASRSDAGESKPGTLSFSPPRPVPLPKGARIVDQIYGDAQTGELDLVSKFRLKGTNSWWHRQVKP